ncbi:hypothetical protein Sjap_026261 [Stephania japonica]|uniref:Uncharacterized protein n=1 Tax=Stephania japonica TaxID=461633 RepID=A0AAP0E5T2_9MAGN
MWDGQRFNCTQILKKLVEQIQLRHIAVLATAKRVAYELGLHLGKEVGFQVRHDRRVGSTCSIKFTTDGITCHDLKDKNQLLDLIQEFSEGIQAIDLKDEYPNCFEGITGSFCN